MRLAFVTPAHRRVSLTAVCLAQRARLIDELAAQGIEAHAVVVADDENADTAEALGLRVLRRPNYALGRKFNDGIEYACRELEADYVCPIGSDQWVHLRFFDGLGAQDAIRSGRDYAIVSEDGGRLAHLVCDYRGLVGPRVIPRALLAHCGFRPADDSAPRGIDNSTLRGIAAAPAFGRRGRPSAGRVEDIAIEAHDVPELGALRYVDFKSCDVQMNGYVSLRDRFGVREDDDPWATLASAYPADLVERMRGHYSARPALAPAAGAER